MRLAASPEERAELPEGLARAGAPASVHAMQDRGGDLAQPRRRRAGGAPGRSATCRVAGRRRFRSTRSGARRSSCEARHEFLHEARNGLAVGARGEGQRHAMLEHGFGERDDVGQAGARAPVEQRAGASPASAPARRAGQAPCDVADDGRVAFAGAPDRTRSRMASIVVSRPAGRRTRRCACMRSSTLNRLFCGATARRPSCRAGCAAARRRGRDRRRRSA